MRALAAGNKKRFAMFAIIIIVIIGLLIACLQLVLKNGNEEFEVSSNVFVYDKEYTPIKTEQEGKLKQKWDGNYYLTLNDKSQTYKMGKQVISYNISNSKINLYGNLFRVLLDGQVEKLSGNTEIKDANEDRFYKIADRQYLIVSNSIKNDMGSIATSKYLYIIIDKAGNTLLLNNEINAKTINPMVILTGSYRFDIANEKLLVGQEEIDLKKIIGSTNEYKEKEKTEEKNETNSKTEENKDNSNDKQNQGTQNNGQTNMGGTTGDAQGNNNSGSSSSGNNSNININTGNNSNNSTPLVKSVSLRGAFATSSYIDLDYAVIDPANKYQTVYAFIETTGFDKTIALDKNATKYRFTDLVPNTEYKITLGYKEIQSDNSIQDNIEDVIIVRTTKIDALLKITKVSGSKVYFNLKMDPNYAFDFAKIAIYVDGEKQEDMNVNVDKAVLASGWSSSMQYTKYGSEITLRLESITHNGEEVDTSIEAKYKNY